MYVFKYIWEELLILIKEFNQIIKKKETIIIWIFLLPITIVIVIVNIIVGLINYFRLWLLFFYKFIQKKFKYKNYKKIKPIKINKRIVSFNNYILQTFYFLTIDNSLKKSFLLFYNQLYLIINIFKNKNNKIKEKIKNIFEILIFILFRKLFYYLTSVPFFIIKINNEITLLIVDIYNMNCDTWEIYFSTLFANLIKNYNLINSAETKKLKVKFNNNKKKYI